MNCFKANRISNVLLFLGAGVALFGTAGTGSVPEVVLMACGLAAMVSGLVVGFVYLKCPRCGKALYRNARLPGRVPAYCPHCGEKICSDASE